MQSKLVQIVRLISIPLLLGQASTCFAMYCQGDFKQDSSRAEEYYKKTMQVRFKDMDLAQVYLDSAELLFAKIGHQEGIARKTYYKSILHYTAGDFDKAIKQALHYLDWTREAGNRARESYALSTLAKFNREKGNLAEAISYSLEGLKLSEDLENFSDQGYYAAELGNLYSSLQQHEKALEYIQKSYDVADEIGYATGKAVSLRNLAENALDRDDSESAISYLLQSISIDSTTDYKIGLLRAYRNLGALFEDRNKLAVSEKYYQKALDLDLDDSNKLDLAYVQLGMAKVELRKGNTIQAKSYLERADEIGEGVNALEFKLSLARVKADLFASSRKYKEAYEAILTQNEMNSQLLNENISNQITGLNIQYETEKKESEIERLELADHFNEVQLRRQRMAIIGLLLVIVLVGGLWYRIRRQKSQIESQSKAISIALSEKDTLLREIHHRVKNNLQFVSSLLNLQSRHVEDPTALTALREGQNRVKSMALIHQNLYQEDNLTGIEVKVYFEKLIQSLFTSYNVAPNRIKLKIDIQNVNLDVDSVIPIGLIVNELVSNALKHAFPDNQSGFISVTLKEDSDHLFLGIADNGIGMDYSDRSMFKKSFGYRLINAFQSQLDADLNINGESGTSIEMRIKEYQKVA